MDTERNIVVVNTANMQVEVEHPIAEAILGGDFNYSFAMAQADWWPAGRKARGAATEAGAWPARSRRSFPCCRCNSSFTTVTLTRSAPS